ncbi:hypothetical protein [Oligella sp. MSHR50489EDL]|uniref:hypothetical protein n=1 Tax=Oligella sp. MSHR50489EDL TaxID=3139409 RepID=UPI003D8164DC
MPKKQAFIDKSGVKFVENFQKNQKIKKFPSRTEIRYLTAFMQKSHDISSPRLYSASTSPFRRAQSTFELPLDWIAHTGRLFD